MRRFLVFLFVAAIVTSACSRHDTSLLPSHSIKPAGNICNSDPDVACDGGGGDPGGGSGGGAVDTTSVYHVMDTVCPNTGTVCTGPTDSPAPATPPPPVPLQYYGGTVITHPQVYIVYWGGWQSDPANERPYLQSFFASVGGSDWLNTVTQYYGKGYTGCGTPPPGYVNCLWLRPGFVRIQNPTGILIGILNDPSTPPTLLPSTPVQVFQNALGAEAISMAEQTGNFDALYVLAFPTQAYNNYGANGFCGSHGFGTDTAGTFAAFAFVPYVVDAGVSCYGNTANTSLDGVSVVAGHELAEALTDPQPYDGWVGAARYREIGDQCEGGKSIQQLNGTSFAVQALWSNATNSSDPGVACVLQSQLFTGDPTP